MEEFSLETVYQAIDTLYRNTDCERKNEADRYLIKLQKSVRAWEIGNELLRRQIDFNSCYFGAQMIRNKIIFSFHELPPIEVIPLHNSLMQHLKNITNVTDSIIIITQLCVSLVDLSLQMSTWNNPITSYLNECKDIPPLVLLEILRVFPEEIDTKQIRLGANRRNEIENELSNCAGLLNNYLTKVTLEDASQEILLKAIRCFSSWVNIIRNIDDIVNCDLMPKVFKILTNPSEPVFESSSSMESKLHDGATDLLCNVLRILRVPDGDQLLEMYLKIIATFENAYHISVARESVEKSINYCRIFAELGEAFLYKLMHQTKPDNRHCSLQVMELILNCVGHHDYEVCSITFNFWFSLSELLHRYDDDELSNEFKPYVSRLLIALCRQVQLEPDSEGVLDDNGDDFIIFRERVCDLVRDSIFIVGSTSFFREIFMIIQTELSWDQLEAYLFIMYSIAWKISPSENDVIPRTVGSILSFPDSLHVAVRYTGILILGELRDWFNEHPDYLIPALQYLHKNLENRELADVAATSLCSICSSAKIKLKNEFLPLREILINLPTLSNKSAINIIKAFVLVMCQLSPEEVHVHLKIICNHHAGPLLKIIKDYETSVENIDVTNGSHPIIWLDRIGATFKLIKETNSTDETALPNEFQTACYSAFSEIHPVLLKIMDIYQTNLDVMERCCRCIRFGIRCIGKIGMYTSVVEPLIEKLMHLYQHHKHSCFLYLGSIIVDEYGNDSATWEVLLKMLDAFIFHSFVLLKTENGLRDNPDTVDDLFRLCCRVLQRLPIAFLNSATGTVWSLLECATAAISIEHREANASVMKFLHELFDCTNCDEQLSEPVKREYVRQIYEKNGEILLRNLLHASVLLLPSYTFVNVAEVIFDLITFNSQITNTWIESGILELPNRSLAGSMMASSEQIQTFLNCCRQATKTRDVSKALRDFALYYT